MPDTEDAAPKKRRRRTVNTEVDTIAKCMKMIDGLEPEQKSRVLRSLEARYRVAPAVPPRHDVATIRPQSHGDG